MDPNHVGIETFDDVADQLAWSHHWKVVDGRSSIFLRHIDTSGPQAGPHGEDGGHGPEEPAGRRDRSPFTSDSGKQVALFTKP